MSQQTTNQSPVLIGTWAGVNDQLIGVLELNRPQALNALDLKMVTLLQAALERWRSDERVVCVVLRAAGERAFCAGGDVKGLYGCTPAYGEPWNKSDLKNPAVEFFTREYLLDRLIHSYPKPIVVLGQGLIMGGGLGLFANASHRVLAEEATLAMPEITIGFIPDVAASWFLNRTPSVSGEFMALTGVSINAADGLAMGLADHCVLRDSWQALEVAFKYCHWSRDGDEVFAQVSELLAERALVNDRRLLPPQLLASLSDIESWYQRGAELGVIEQLAEYQGDSELLREAAAKVSAGCPVSIRLVHQLLARSCNLSFPECQAQELNLALNVIAAGHFHEGVRAQLVDKDRSPQWQNQDVSDSALAAYFDSPWPAGRHPLI